MTYIRLVSILLSFCLGTQSVLAQHQTVPHGVPHIVELSFEQMQTVLSDPSVKSTRLLVSQTQNPADTVKIETEKNKKVEEKEVPPLPVENDEAKVGLFGNINFGGNGGARETALIVFAVVGLVIVVAWIPYFPILLYESAIGKRDINKIHQLSLQHVLSGKYGHGSSSEDSETLRYGSLIGGRYSLFLKDPGDEESLGTLGFSAELGYYRFKDRGNNLVSKVEGMYWLLGPSMLFGATNGEGFPLFAKLDLLAGSSFDSDLGLVSRADLTLGSYIFNSNMSLGLGVGALYLHSKNGHGTLNNGEQLGLIFSGNLGYSF